MYGTLFGPLGEMNCSLKINFMNFNTLTSRFRKVVPAIILSAIFVSCNDDNKGNKSTGDNDMDTTNMTNGPYNNTTVGPADSNGTGTGVAATGTTGTATTGDTSSTRMKRKGRVTAAMTADDLKTKMEMDKQGYYNRSEVAPMYNGGQAALENYIQNNLQYPSQAIDNNVEGEVRVQFAVDNNGNVSNVSTVGNKLGYGLEDEAIKVVSAMPKWTPGKVKGKSVKTWRTLPITYRLES